MKLSNCFCIGLLLFGTGFLPSTSALAQSRPGNRNGDFGGRLKMMMQRFDTDNDGVVTKSEFKGPAERFSRMDGDSDGKITTAEIADMQNRMREMRQRNGNRRTGDGLSQRHGPDKSPAVGQQAPNFTLKLLNSEETVTLSEIYADKPVVLTLGSYTCPPFRGAIEGIEELSQKYSKEFAFYFVYIKEAHTTDERPSRGNERSGIDFKQPTTYLERESIAKTCQKQIELTMPILVDTLDNAVERLYAGAPNRTYVMDQNGIVLYKGVRGPQGTRPDDVAKAIRKQLSSVPASKDPTALEIPAKKAKQRKIK